MYAERYGARQKELERQRAEMKPLRVQAETLVRGVRDRSRLAGWPFPEWCSVANVMDWLRRQPECSCCKHAFLIGRKEGRAARNSPSFDRLNSAGQYDRPNVRLICWRCNRIKADSNAADLRMVADWIDRENKL